MCTLVASDELGKAMASVVCLETCSINKKYFFLFDIKTAFLISCFFNYMYLPKTIAQEYSYAFFIIIGNAFTKAK